MPQTSNLLDSARFRLALPSLSSVQLSRPRHLLHGAIAVAVTGAAVASVALQPRSYTPVAEIAVVADSEPIPALDMAQLPPTPADATAEQDVAASEPLTTANVAPTDTPASQATATTPAAPAAPSKPVIHAVEEGETVSTIADKFGINAETIMAANNLRNPDSLQIGQNLVILPTDGVLYTLRNGESLRRVAERFNVETMDIVKANDISDPDVVQPGTLLMVPGVEPVAPGHSTVTVKDVDGEQQIAVVGPTVPIGDPSAPAMPSTRTYEVQAGDTLANIADVFGVDVSTILSSNGIDDPDTIKPGSELRILPVKGIEYTVNPDETLADIAWKYQVDLGLLLDYNDLNDPDMLTVGRKLVLPGGKMRADAIPAPAPIVEAPVARPAAPIVQAPVVQAPAPAAAAAPAPKPVAAAPAPKPVAQAPAPKPAPAPEPAAEPASSGGGGGGSLVAAAMKYVGYRYVFGGTSPAGFDCSGFVYYIHNRLGIPTGRGMWQQYNGGAHIPMSALQPGDTVFFANTYMAGLSHDGIYIGGGRFVHASDESTGVTISNLYSSYWQGHYAGATRLWN